MIIYDENGQYTPLFAQYEAEVLTPEIEQLARDIVAFLHDNGATPVDYRIIQQVVEDLFALEFSSEWMTLIEKQIAE